MLELIQELVRDSTGMLTNVPMLLVGIVIGLAAVWLFWLAYKRVRRKGFNLSMRRFDMGWLTDIKISALRKLWYGASAITFLGLAFSILWLHIIYGGMLVFGMFSALFIAVLYFFHAVLPSEKEIDELNVTIREENEEFVRVLQRYDVIAAEYDRLLALKNLLESTAAINGTAISDSEYYQNVAAECDLALTRKREYSEKCLKPRKKDGHELKIERASDLFNYREPVDSEKVKGLKSLTKQKRELEKELVREKYVPVIASLISFCLFGIFLMAQWLQTGVIFSTWAFGPYTKGALIVLSLLFIFYMSMSIKEVKQTEIGASMD